MEPAKVLEILSNKCGRENHLANSMVQLMSQESHHQIETQQRKPRFPDKDDCDEK